MSLLVFFYVPPNGASSEFKSMFIIYCHSRKSMREPVSKPYTSFYNFDALYPDGLCPVKMRRDESVFFYSSADRSESGF